MTLMCDGDKSLVIQDRTLTAVAKRNMKDIVPLYYEMHKAKGGMLSNNVLYEGMAHAYTGGNIGPISNNITKVWNSGKIEEEQLNVVKWLCLYNNAVIDYAKTLWLPTPPKEIDKIIKSYTKANVPHFFIYAKDKQTSQVEQLNNSTMNRISSSIPTSRVKFSKKIDKFDYRMLMNKNVPFTVAESPIIDAYNYWVNHRYTIEEINENISDEDLWMYRQIKKELLKLHENEDFVTNTLINYCYTVKINSSKKLLWACFGDIIVKNLKENTKDLGNICPICGKRFTPINSLQKCCSLECAQQNNVENQRERDANR